MTETSDDNAVLDSVAVRILSPVLVDCPVAAALIAV